MIRIFSDSRSLQGILCACIFLICASVSAQESTGLKVDMKRHAYYRGEVVPVTVTFTNTGAAAVNAVVLSAGLPGGISSDCTVGPVRPGESVTRLLRLPTGLIKTGKYELKVSASHSGRSVSATEAVAIGASHNPDTLLVWSWGGNGGEWDSEHGINSWPGTTWAQKEYANDEAFRKRLDDALINKGFANVHPNGGLSDRDMDISDIEDPDVRYTRLSSYYREHNYTMPNPFHQEVAARQREQNRKLMEVVKDYPQIKTAFFNSELQDMMEINLNKGGLELMQASLGFTDTNTGDPSFVAPNVIADDDKGYLLHKYIHKQGKGWSLANKRAAEMVDRYRPDILTMTDPFRETALLDMFPGIDVVGTWTYTNPDPKLMLFVETMRAVCKPTNQIPLNVVTMLEYPGSLAPTDKWMAMGPGRLKVTTWINLSRAPKILGYYPTFKGGSNYPDPDCFENPIGSPLALKELSEKVFKPYGPMLTNLDVEPRRVAVLSSAAAQLYGKSPRLAGGYGNFQIYHFYSLLAMAHIQADVLFDEHIERFGLGDYDVLVLPKCDVLTKSVYDSILEFQKRGGLVIADQYLGPEIPGVIKFDFDFTYREKVNANAIAKNTIYANWDDHLQPESAELKQVTGVTALDDQKIMESYAARLKEGLKGKVEPEVDCDQPTVLFNMLEKDGAKYLVVINDKRAYDDRVGKYKAMLGKIEPQTVTITLKNWKHPGLAAYDMLEQKPLAVRKTSDVYQFTLPLTELGGKIVALYPRRLAKLAIEFPENAVQGAGYPLLVNLTDAGGASAPGLQPVQLTITDPQGNQDSLSDYYCAKKGVLALDFVPALNDVPGRWKIAAHDLTSGLKAEKFFTLAKK